MKSWQIHFTWAIVTVVAVAITWRAASREEPIASRSPAERSAPLRTESKAGIPSMPKTEDIPVSEVLTAQSPSRIPTPSQVEKIRALIKTSHKWEDFRLATKDLTDRGLNLQLAREAMASDNTSAMYWFTTVLRQLKGREAAEILEAALKAHLSDDIGFNLAGALGDVGDPGSLGPLNEAMQSKSRSVRISSAVSLKKLGYAAPTDDMMEALARDFGSPDGSIRRSAVEWMRELDAPMALPVLLRALKDSNGDVRLAAVVAIEGVESLNRLELLEPLVNDPNPEVSKQVKELVEALKSADK